MKTMLKEAGILFAITLIAGLLLGVVHEVTAEPIKKAEEEAKMKAWNEVFSDAASFDENEEGFGVSSSSLSDKVKEAGFKADIEAVVRALDGAGNTLGYVITVNDHEGYGGDIRFSMGIKSDGTLNGISILEISETAGLGMKADPVLTSQLKDIKVDNISFVKGGGGNPSQGTIDAISGATITTTAVTNGVNAGLTAFFEITKGGAGA